VFAWTPIGWFLCFQMVCLSPPDLQGYLKTNRSWHNGALVDDHQLLVTVQHKVFGLFSCEPLVWAFPELTRVLVCRR